MVSNFKHQKDALAKVSLCWVAAFQIAEEMLQSSAPKQLVFQSSSQNKGDDFHLVEMLNAWSCQPGL